MTDVTSLSYEYYNGSSWVDISSYQNSAAADVVVTTGMQTNAHDDRLADVGELTLVLTNTNDEFIPGTTNALTGWEKNVPFRNKIVYDGETYIRFRGYVSGIIPDDVSVYEKRVNVTVYGWMNKAYTKPFSVSSIETNKRADEALETIVTQIGVAPQATQYSEGVNTFDAIFDSVSDEAKATSEMNKIVMSEMGYIYIKNDKTNGETLVFESANDRNGLRELAKIPKLVADCAYLTDESGNYLTDENGNKLLSNDADDCYINETSKAIVRTYGENIINRIVVTAYPKETDTSAVVLYKLDSPIKLAAGETKTVEGSYFNATTKKSCNAITSSMETVTATTDYLMNKKKDGTGTNLTANLTVAATFETDNVSFQLTNGSVYTAWVTKLQCRGLGVYFNASIDENVEDTTSQSDLEEIFELDLDQKAQRDVVTGKIEAQKIVYLEKDPRNKLESITLDANKSSQHMMAFLSINIGDLVQIKQDYGNIDGYYYVQGIKYTITANNKITFTWIVKDAFPSLTNGKLTEVAMEFEDASTEKIDYGIVETILNTPQRTIGLSFYITGTDADFDVLAVGAHLAPDTYNGFFISLVSHIDGGIKYLGVVYINGMFDTTAFWYFNDADTFANVINGWHRLLITHNITNTNEIPSVYYDGNLIPVDSINSTYPTGSFLSEDGLPLFIPYSANPTGGLLKQVCFWNRILTASEIASDATGTITNNGLVFRAPNVLTEKTGDYYDQALTESMKLPDTYLYQIGTPKNSPICREIT